MLSPAGDELMVELFQAVAALLWPIFAFTVLFMYRSQVRELLVRLKRGKVLGQEIELSESLTTLQESAAAVQSEVANLPSPPGPKSDGPPGSCRNEDASTIDRVLTMSAQSPKAALLLLASDLEGEVRRLLATVGRLRGREYVPITQAIAELDEYGLPKHVPSSLRLFWSVRSRIVHGRDATEADTLRAIDSGIAILRALNAIPREENVVHHPGVPIYSDSLCVHQIEGAKGVILQTTSPGGASREFRIFPSTRSHFVKGKRVSSEWSRERRFGEAWYRDPESNEIRLAWTVSMEFIGRHLDEV
jgi:hypothetical protein